MFRRRVFLAAVAVLGLVAAACTGGDPAPDETTDTPTPMSGAVDDVPTERDAVAEAFVAAWNAGDWDRVDALVFDATLEPGRQHAATLEGLDTLAYTVAASGPIEPDGLRARLPVTVTTELDELGTWAYDTEVGVVQVGERWVVEWSSTTIHPGLIEGRELVRRRVWPERGTIRAWDGAPLRTQRPVVEVGVEPQAIGDREVLLDRLESLLDIDPTAVEAALDAPDVQPDWFVPVATVRAEDYPAVADAVEALDGVVVRRDLARLAPADGYAEQVLGTVGPITAEQLAELGEPYDASRLAGRSALELVYERTLAGTPGGDVRLVDRSGALVSVVHTFPGMEAVDVVTTLDADMQAAAEAALDEVELPAALVAIDVGTGQVRAIVSRPVEEFGRALAGTYPPGSTFKTVTAAAFIAGGGSASSSVSCPSETFVGGLRFTNAGGSSLGTVSLATAYAASCNTAFVNAATTVDQLALAAAASDFGFGVDYSIGIATSGANLPEPVDDAEFAASSIGQARVTASPLHMASVAAAVADGTWRSPILVLEPELPAAQTEVTLDAALVDQLRSMMRQVVTSGTGGAAGAAGEVSGKTGSAEFGDDDPPQTHAWFVGYRGDLAFAVLVEGGGAGGSVAAPIAADFLVRWDAARELAGS